MEIYTIQLAQRRLAKELDIPLIDTTVKSGLTAFAPSWDLVFGIKNGTITEAQYRKAFIAIMQQTSRTHREQWEQVLGMDRVALGCYCRSDVFCHRHIVKEALLNICKRRNRTATDCGEITASRSR